MDFACREKFEDNIALTDLFIKVDTEGYTFANLQKDAIDTLIHREETTTRARWMELKRLKKQIGVADGYVARPGKIKDNPFPIFCFAGCQRKQS